VKTIWNLRINYWALAYFYNGKLSPMSHWCSPRAVYIRWSGAGLSLSLNNKGPISKRLRVNPERLQRVQLSGRPDDSIPHRAVNKLRNQTPKSEVRLRRCIAEDVATVPGQSSWRARPKSHAADRQSNRLTIYYVRYSTRVSTLCKNRNRNHSGSPGVHYGRPNSPIHCRLTYPTDFCLE